MDWDGLCGFLQEIRVFLEKSRSDSPRDVIVESLIEKCEFFLSTSAISLRFKDEVDYGKGGTYLNMANTNNAKNTPDQGGKSVVLYYLST